MAWVVASDGTKLHYALAGIGPPLVLHLGAGCSAELWQEIGVVSALAPSYTCILFDHRGHGESDCPRGWQAHTIERRARDVIELLGHLGLHRAAFWGYSSGVDVGLLVAEEHPERVSALIGTSSIPPGTQEDDAAWAMSRIAALEARGWDLLIDEFSEQEPKPIPEWMKARIRATDIGQFIDALEASRHTEWHYWSALPAVGAPTLFIVGEREDPEDLTAQAVARMPNARRARVPGGHIQSFIDAEPVLPIVEEFLTTYAPR